MAYRPRGALARTLFEKFHNDQHLDNLDMKIWYKLHKLLPEPYQSKFVPFDVDGITLEWLEKSKQLSANFWLQIWHSFARTILGAFMTQTDVNGLLKRGSMYILSENQYQQLLTAGGFNLNNFENHSTLNMLDIGAGDGEVTKRLGTGVIQMLESNFYLHLYVTEYSWTMRDRLQEKKFTVVENVTDLTNVHLISCLNVLDRCYDPFKLIQDMYDALAPNGRVIIALVLPYSHYVESNTSHLPLKFLFRKKSTGVNNNNNNYGSFDEEATAFFQELEIIGFKIEAWTKAPYLCEGDLRQSFYWLIDLVVILSKG